MVRDGEGSQPSGEDVAVQQAHSKQRAALRGVRVYQLRQGAHGSGRAFVHLRLCGWVSVVGEERG